MKLIHDSKEYTIEYFEVDFGDSGYPFYCQYMILLNKSMDRIKQIPVNDKRMKNLHTKLEIKEFLIDYFTDYLDERKIKEDRINALKSI